jgi:GNAT superfamily N-acetyltransferase
MQLVPFRREHAPDAAAMFVASLDALRNDVPALSGALAATATVADRLADMSGFAAVEDGRLAGYLTSWFPIESFRDVDRTGAYSPEWAHGAVGGDRAAIYRALYRAASAQWAAARCDVHAITLLAGDDVTVDTWFWSGFGMGTVDGVRPMTPLNRPAPVGYSVRAATVDDAPLLAGLHVEHNLHYTEPPVFMALRAADDPDGWSTFLTQPGNTAWLAEDSGGLFGYLRFDRAFTGADVTASDAGVFINGAYVRASHRRRGAATAMLDAALRHYADQGLECCAVDFEAFNPEAAAFWTRHFTPVCRSLMRVPESLGAGESQSASVDGHV